MSERDPEPGHVPDIFIRSDDHPQQTNTPDPPAPVEPSQKRDIFDFGDEPPVRLQPIAADDSHVLTAEDFDDAPQNTPATPDAPPPTPEEHIALLEQRLAFVEGQFERLIKALIRGDQEVLKQLRAEQEERDNEQALRLWNEIPSAPSDPKPNPNLNTEPPNYHAARKILENFSKRRRPVPT